MKHFLMCDPKFFGVCYVINPWMKGNQGKVNKALARHQWQNLHDIVEGMASVSLIDPVEGLPDMVFTANAGLVHGKDVILSSFLHAERQPESNHFERFFSSLGYNVKHIGEGTIFEGAGDALFDTQGRLWLGSGIRSDAHALGEIKAVFDVEGSGLKVKGVELVDPHWYHLDTAFCPLPQGQAIAYTNAFSERSVTALNAAFGENIVWVSEEDAKNFSCNAVAIGQAVIMHRASDELKATLLQRGFRVIETDVSEFLKAGGACKCLTLEI